MFRFLLSATNEKKIKKKDGELRVNYAVTSPPFSFPPEVIRNTKMQIAAIDELHLMLKLGVAGTKSSRVFPSYFSSPLHCPGMCPSSLPFYSARF